MGNKQNIPKVEPSTARKSTQVTKDPLEMSYEVMVNIALQYQQNLVKGPLQNCDLIAILIMLNPSRNIIPFTYMSTKELTAAIRHDLYSHI